MAVLTRSAIREALAAREIEIDPFDDSLINTNSLDVRLGPDLIVYKRGCFDMKGRRWIGEPEKHRGLAHWGEDGFILNPGVLVVAHTIETTYTPKHVPKVFGKSSLSRMGLQIHSTGGFGDVGFRGQWTLSLTCTVPIILRYGLPIAQIEFSTIEGEPEGYNGRYQNSVGIQVAKA